MNLPDTFTTGSSEALANATRRASRNSLVLALTPLACFAQNISSSVGSMARRGAAAAAALSEEKAAEDASSAAVLAKDFLDMAKVGAAQVPARLKVPTLPL